MNSKNACGTLDESFCLSLINQNLTRNHLKKVYLPYCPLECDKISYSLSTYHSYYPSPDYANFLQKHLIIKKLFKNSNYSLSNNAAINYDSLKKNIASINVFYDDPRYTKVSQVAKMSLEDLTHFSPISDEH